MHRWMKSVDDALAKSYPRAYALRLTTVFPLAVGMSILATFHGLMTPGTMDKINNTLAVTAAWFFVCTMAAAWWIVIQWRVRWSLPRGCRAGLAWSPVSNFLCLAMIFAPTAAYSFANTSAIRGLGPLDIILNAYDEMDHEFPGNSSEDGSLAPMFYSSNISTSWGYCHDGASQCLASGYKLYRRMQFNPSMCPIGGKSDAQAALTALYGATRVQILCARAYTSERRRFRWKVLHNDAAVSRAETELETNVQRFFVAHNASTEEAYMHGWTTTLAVVLFLTLLSAATASASAINVQALAKVTVPSVCGLAFATTFRSPITSALSGLISNVFLGLLVIVVSTSVVALATSKVRTSGADMVALSALVSGFFLFTLWWMLAPDSFNSMSPYARPLELDPPRGQVCCSLFVVLFFFASPLVMRLLDRYRNLPRR